MADVLRRHREAAVLALDGEIGRCGHAFIEQKPELCTCEGRGFAYRVRFPQAAKAFADWEAQAIEGAVERGRAAEREAIVSYARRHNYGHTLRTFIKHVVREYHLEPEVSGG